MRNGYRAPSPAGKALIRKYRFPYPTSAPLGHLLPMEGGSVHASPFPWKGLPSAARRGWLSFLRRSGALVNGVLETIFPALFHTASTLSGSLRSPPSPRGEGCVSGIAVSPSNLRPFGAPPSIGRRELSTRAPSLGRGCRAQRGGVGFLFCGEAASSLPSPCRESCVILVPSSTNSIALTRASQRGAGSILRLFDRHAFSGGNPLHLFSNVLPHRRRGQDRPARGIPLCGYSL